MLPGYFGERNLPTWSQVRLKNLPKILKNHKKDWGKSKTQQESTSCTVFVQGQVVITHMHSGENLAPFLLDCCGPHATGGGVLVLGQMCISSVQLHATVSTRRGKISLSWLSCAAEWHRMALESPRKGSLFQLIICPEAAHAYPNRVCLNLSWRPAEQTAPCHPPRALLAHSWQLCTCSSEQPWKVLGKDRDQAALVWQQEG